MVTQSQVEVGQHIYYEPFPGATRERWVVSSFPEDTDFIFVRYTEGITGARTACSDLFLHSNWY